MTEGMNDEDRAWLESDLSRLGEYPPYELTEEQLAGELPIRHVPGVGLVADDNPGERRAFVLLPLGRVAALLEGSRVVVSVSEPFDFEGPDGPNEIRGVVDRARPSPGEFEISVGQFADPKDPEASPVERLVARARYRDGKDVVGELADGGEPDVNLFYKSRAGNEGHLIGSVCLAGWPRGVSSTP